MTETIANSNILYLDDSTRYLDHTKSFFERNGYLIATTRSIDEAKELVKSNGIQLFICDLRLEEISELVKGNDILKDIRASNKNIFLALYTAFYKDIKTEEKILLEKNSIKIYDKSDETFILNLEKDYSNFLAEQGKKISLLEKEDAQIVEEVKNKVVSHLKEISNQNVAIVWRDGKQISVGELIHEVEIVSDIGREYMTEWLNIITIYQNIQRNKNK
jgi:response regulator RpfG family c-di-GMP phosphodiesterase